MAVTPVVAGRLPDHSMPAEFEFHRARSYSETGQTAR